MSNKTSYIIDLLGKGYAPKSVAKILDVSPSLVSQVGQDNADAVEDKRQDLQMVNIARDSDLDEIEDLLLTKLRAVAALESDSMKILRIWEAVARAPRHSNKEQQPTSGVTQQTIVQLNIPDVARERVEYTVNPNNEVVGVNGRSIVTASSKQVVDMMHASISSKKASAYADIESAKQLTQSEGN